MIFGERGPNGEQATIFSQPSYLGMQMPQSPVDLAPASTAEPFTWGAGGARLTPDQLALRQKQALNDSQIDYSPIQSPWQGLARVAQNAIGGFEQRDVDKQSALMQADRKQTINELLAQQGGAPGAVNPVAAALLSDDPAVQKLGMAQWERDNPKPVNNDTVQDYQFRVQTLGQPAADEWLRRGNDPFISVNTPTGFYAGPQSGLAAAMGVGGGAPAAAPGNIPIGSPLAPPATLPPDFDFSGGR